MIKREAECGLGIGIQEFLKQSLNWKYAHNWKGHTCLSKEGFSKRGTTKAWNERLASLAINVEKIDRVTVLCPTRHKIGHF